MKLTELLAPWICRELPHCEITGLHNDSRLIGPGFLFIAYAGALTDGRCFIAQAVKLGARAVLYDPQNWPNDCQLSKEIIAIALPELAKKLPHIASRFYNEPAKKLSILGVTGTNGKTTIAYQLAQAQALLGSKSAYIGTLGQGEINHLQPLANTTPDGLCLQGLLHNYHQQGVKQVCMEVSSHALHQQRVEAIEFKQAIFTNLSHDHLDYHHTMAAYAAAKALLFATPTLEWAIINQDDEYSQIMITALPPTCQRLTYGITKPAQVRAVSWEISRAGTKISLSSPWGSQELNVASLGFFNIYNALAIFSALVVQGYAIDKITALMSQIHAAPGRMEVIAREPYVIVDYAHTPAALENTLSTLKKLNKGQLIVVFGCGGDRDKTKRPLMGKIASQYADKLIITNDNPRNEDPLAIINAITEGLSPRQFAKIPDREQAIAKALSLASSEDLILVAGKGHETYQQIGNIRHPFSDQQTIKNIIK